MNKVKVRDMMHELREFNVSTRCVHPSHSLAPLADGRTARRHVRTDGDFVEKKNQMLEKRHEEVHRLKSALLTSLLFTVPCFILVAPPAARTRAQTDALGTGHGAAHGSGHRVHRDQDDWRRRTSGQPAERSLTLRLRTEPELAGLPALRAHDPGAVWRGLALLPRLLQGAASRECRAVATSHGERTQSLRHGAASMDVLIVMGSTSAYVYSLAVVVLFCTDPEFHGMGASDAPPGL
jgi:cation transport ATPase